MGGRVLSKPLIEMTKAELKQYLSDNRNNDEKFSEAMKVLLQQMPLQETWNPPFNSLQDGEKFFQQDRKK